MRRYLRYFMRYAPLGPIMLLVSCATALAQDPGGPHTQMDDSQVSAYIMQMGPYGALVWGAWALRGLMETLKGGIQISITHKHEMTDAGIEAIEKVAEGWRQQRRDRGPSGRDS